tara:strand:+ start:1964 stop:2584 length:621 start_codon:yes stop_codon:yes gene_type:complete
MINIEIQNMYFKYNSRNIFSNLSLKFDSKGITSICGRNGVGKTTLLRLIAGFIQPSKGIIKKPENLTIGYIFQNPIFLNRTVKENLLHAILSINQSLNKNIVIKNIDDTLEKYSLKHTRDLSINKLSGGQQQMIAIIRSLMINPDVLLCDEPTSNLDASNKKIIEELLLEKSCHKKVILVTQDNEQAIKISKKIYTLENDKISKIF